MVGRLRKREGMRETGNEEGSKSGKEEGEQGRRGRLRVEGVVDGKHN